jgi:hypothetical protein
LVENKYASPIIETNPRTPVNFPNQISSLRNPNHSVILTAAGVFALLVNAPAKSKDPATAATTGAAVGNFLHARKREF